MIEILHIDCMIYMGTQPDKIFDIAVVDPPYGRNEDGGTNRSHGVKQKNGTILQCLDGNYVKKYWDKEPPPVEYFNELRRVSKHQIIWGINYMPTCLPGGRIIWDKMNYGSDQSDAEIAYCSLNDRVDIVQYMWRGMMQGECVGSFRQRGNKALNEKRIHPTQKPVVLYEWLFQQYARPKMKILDTHLGSGSSAIAAYRYGLNFVGCEIDPEYWQAARNRYEAETKQIALFSPNPGFNKDGDAAC